MHVRPNSPPSEIAAHSTVPFSRSIGSVLAGATAVGAAALLTWIAAEIRVPLQPVPVTMQTLVVLLAGAFIGSARGCASQIAYLGMGLAGVPLFAGGAAGLAVVSGPTGGYLLGFIVAPFIVGRWIGTSPRFVRALGVFSAGALAILALGVLHLAVFYTSDFGTAVRVGLLPFLLGDAIKVVAAASFYVAYRRLHAGPLSSR